MELRPGYKKTEMGVIPEDWDVLPLKEILLSAELGGNYPNSAAPTAFPLMKMGNVSRGRFDLSKLEFVSRGVVPDENHRLNNGDVIFNTRNTLDLVGKIAVWRDEIPVAYFNSNLMRLHFDPSKIASHEYANLTLNTEATLSRLRAMATGTTSVAAIYTRDLLGLPVIVPPGPEQKAIAETLADVDATIAALSRLIAKKRDLRHGAVQALLTGRTRLAGFSVAWQVKRLGELGGTYGGLTGKTKADFGSGNARYVTFLNVISNAIIDIGALDLVSVGQNEKQNQVLRGDILFNGSSETPEEVALCSYVDFAASNVFLNSFCFGYRRTYSREIDGRFLVHYLRGDAGRRIVRELAQGSTRYNISKSALMKIEVPVPEFDEQQAIVSAIMGFDAEIVALRERVNKTRALKQAMMQALLTGEVRLPLPRAAAHTPKEAAYA